MTSQLLFDASSIYKLVKHCPERAQEVLCGQSTIALAYYELGNALWRECFLSKKMSQAEAETLLVAFYEVLQTMKVVLLDDEFEGNVVLKTACDSNLTFYDSAYLANAKVSKKMLVTDDKKLAKTAEIVGVTVCSSESFLHQ